MAIDFSSDPAVTDALRQWRSRKAFPTEFGSADLRKFSREFRLRSVFAARATNAAFVDEIARVVDDALSGKINLATARWRLKKKLKEEGYDPAKGFPQDMANVPPAERGSLQDLSSERRLNLILETNQRMAVNYGKMVAGNGDYARYAYPAWELIRLYSRRIERGSQASKSTGWDERWHDAGESVRWVGALVSPMIALKDSPIWQALGDGDGGYTDALNHPFPPFAFNSGMGWRAVPRVECVRLKLVSGDAKPKPMEGQLSPGAKEVRAAFNRLSPDLQAALRKELLGKNIEA